jgi:hypothetical protein
MGRIIKQTVNSQKSPEARREYAFRRMIVAVDRVIAGKTKKQRRKDVAWARLWHKHWKSQLTNTK